MDRVIYTALGGANAALTRQSITSHNLANATTDGFRSQLSAYRAIPVTGSGMATRTLSLETTPSVNLSEGPVYHTGKALDVALPMYGWLAVAMSDGKIAYTRNGNIQKDDQGQLSANGYPVLSDGRVINVPPEAVLAIAADGTISAVDMNSHTHISVGHLEISEGNSHALMRGDDGLFHTRDGEPLPINNDFVLRIGMLERSNVNPVAAMTEMIAVARNFEMQLKIISAVDVNEKSANKLLGVS